MAFTGIATVPKTAAQQLYADIDLSKLNPLERLWAAWYMWFDDPMIATGLVLFLSHELVYFGRCTAWMVIDAIPYFQKWKIQPNKASTPEEQWECTKQIFLTHLVAVFPATFLFHPMAEKLGMEIYQVPFPSWKTILLQVILFFLIADTLLYFVHRALHWGPLYKHIHKHHHKYTAPFGLAAQYGHPAEAFIGGSCLIAGPIIYCYFARNLHILAVEAWLMVSLCGIIDAHAGYDLPLLHIIPFTNFADRHDFHHLAFTSNYSTLGFCDRLFGTDKKYREYRKRVSIMKAAMKNKNKTELEAGEHRLKEEVREQGYRDQAIAEGCLGE